MSSDEPRVLYNLLEPPGLLRHFAAAPPQDFSAFSVAGGVPAFATAFDLLTTIDPAARRKLEALPLARRWRRLLQPHTCFVGTTVSEYALFPGPIAPDAFVRHLLDELAPRYPLLIVKDIPTEPVLVGAEAHAYARRFADACRRSGFVMVQGQALAYVPVDFSSVGDFLARLSASRRKDLRRKLKASTSLDVRIIRTGDALFADEAVLTSFYALYLNVYRQSDIHFDLLSPAFFRALLQDAGSGGVVFVYRAGEDTIGYNICFVHAGALLDKYVGFLYPHARTHNLYAVSWFRNLEYALAHGLRYYIAGWTDPEIKRHLGARFTFTQHAVYVRNPVLRTMLAPFKRFFETDYRWYAAHEENVNS